MGLNPLVADGVLAVDAGNSKTDVALVAADGTVLGTARGGGFQPQIVGTEAAVEVIARIVELAADAAGLSPRELEQLRETLGKLTAALHGAH